eukprot:2992393-Amphidinium_carterae.1
MMSPRARERREERASQRDIGRTRTHQWTRARVRVAKGKVPRREATNLLGATIGATAHLPQRERARARASTRSLAICPSTEGAQGHPKLRAKST